MQERIGAEAISRSDLLTVELQEIVVLQILVATELGYPMQGKGTCLGSKHVGAEGDIGMVVVEQREHRRHDVGLLHDALRVVAVQVGQAGRIEDDGHGVAAQRGGVEGVDVVAGVVGRDDEQRAVEPRRAAGRLEEPAQGVVGVGNALLQLAFALGETVGVALRQAEGIV